MVPKRYKRCVILGFVYRIYRARSSSKKFHESSVKAKDILERNQYPPNFYEPIISAIIERLLNRVLRKLITMVQTTKIYQQKLI